LRKPKGISRMDNPETLGTMDTQSTGRRLKKKEKKHTYNAIQKTKQIATRTPPKKADEIRGSRRSIVPFIV